jgi:MFS family permease
MIVFRVLQGASAAMLFPAAPAIVVAAFPLRERGRALAVFFAVPGALTAVGPIAGGCLTEWTWRAIFWINVPVAVIAVVLTLRANPEEGRRSVPIDYRGAVLASGAMGLLVSPGSWPRRSPSQWPGSRAVGSRRCRRPTARHRRGQP